MSKKNWIMVKRGLSEDAKHREAMGNRIWLYLHIIDRCDWDTGIVYDWRDGDEAEDMGLNLRTLERQRQELTELGYIECKQRKHGQDIAIYNWINPRNYSGGVLNKKGTQTFVPLRNKGTHKGTQKGVLQGNKELRTPSLESGKEISGNQGSADKPRHTSAVDPRSQSPEIQMVRQVIGRYPSKDQYDIVIKLAAGLSFEQCVPAWEEWRKRGYKPTNFSWLDWARNGIPETPNGKRNGSSERVVMPENLTDEDVARLYHEWNPNLVGGAQ